MKTEASVQSSSSPRSSVLSPYIASQQHIPEFTLRAVLLGTLMSILFGMVNAYLGLKVGLTVSASIPSAVMSMAILRGLLRRGTILENNVVHTIASAGESLAAGVVFTIPAFIFIGVDPGGFRIFLIGATAGFLGILMMIPLRHHLTVVEHGQLPFPEGTACSQVLIAGDRGPAAWRPVFLGILVGAGYQFAMRGLRLWHDTVFVTIARLHKMSFGAELTPIFLGVGYLIGPRIAGTMFAGGLLAWAVLLPAFDALGGTSAGALFGISPQVGAMGASEIWRTYVRFVGAGGVACGGIISIVRVLPIIVESVQHSVRVLIARDATRPVRTEHDLPPAVVIGGTGLLAVALWLIPTFEMGFVQAAAGGRLLLLLRRRFGAHGRADRHDVAASLRHDHHGTARDERLARRAGLPWAGRRRSESVGRCDCLCRRCAVG